MESFPLLYLERNHKQSSNSISIILFTPGFLNTKRMNFEIGDSGTYWVILRNLISYDFLHWLLSIIYRNYSDDVWETHWPLGIEIPICLAFDSIYNLKKNSNFSPGSVTPLTTTSLPDLNYYKTCVYSFGVGLKSNWEGIG